MLGARERGGEGAQGSKGEKEARDSKHAVARHWCDVEHGISAASTFALKLVRGVLSFFIFARVYVDSRSIARPVCDKSQSNTRRASWSIASNLSRRVNSASRSFRSLKRFSTLSRLPVQHRVYYVMTCTGATRGSSNTDPRCVSGRLLASHACTSQDCYRRRAYRRTQQRACMLSAAKTCSRRQGARGECDAGAAVRLDTDSCRPAIMGRSGSQDKRQGVCGTSHHSGAAASCHVPPDDIVCFSASTSRRDLIDLRSVARAKKQCPRIEKNGPRTNINSNRLNRACMDHELGISD